MSRARPAVALIGVLSLLAFAGGPAAAADAQHQRDQTAQRRGQVRSALNLAIASDARVEAETIRLATLAEKTATEVAAAQSASEAASRQLSAASVHLDEVTARTETIRKALVDRVIESYSHPFRQEALILSGSLTVNDLARRQELLNAAVGRDSDTLDAFRQSRQEMTNATRALTLSQKVAAERAQAVTARATELTKAQADAQAAHAELSRRIADLTKESADLAAQEGSIEALIQAQQAQSQAALARQAAQRSVPPPAAAAADPGPAGNSQESRPTPVRRSPAGGLIWPIHGPVTSEYGPRWGGFHPGIDIAPPYGTPIVAAKDGVVIFAGSNGGYGNFVLVDHGGGIVTGYAHQSRIAVSQGQLVTQGELVGYEGSTGDSTGPHLHFEVRVNGSPQNPRDYVAGQP